MAARAAAARAAAAAAAKAALAHDFIERLPQGYETVISRYVDDQLTVVVLTNLDAAKPGTIADHVAEMYLSGKAQ